MTKLKSDLPPYAVKAINEFDQFFYEKLISMTPAPYEKRQSAVAYQDAMNDISAKLNQLMIDIRLRDYPSDVTASACSATGDLLREPVHEDENSPF